MLMSYSPQCCSSSIGQAGSMPGPASGLARLADAGWAECRPQGLGALRDRGLRARACDVVATDSWRVNPPSVSRWCVTPS